MNDDDRYISIEESIIQSCKEVKLMQAGLMPKHTWDELKSELQKEFAEDLDEERRQQVYGDNLVCAL